MYFKGSKAESSKRSSNEGRDTQSDP